LSIGLEPAPELREGSKDRPFFHTNAPTTARGQWGCGAIRQWGLITTSLFFLFRFCFVFEKNSLIAKISEKSNKISGIYSK